MVWAGDRLVVWGGWPTGADTSKVDPDAGGYAFDPTRRRWEAIPDAPVGAGGGQAIWTGSEILFWGVETAHGTASLAFDPASGTWRTIADPPHDPDWGGVSVWTGSELILWGGGDRGSATMTEGAAYDPATDVWSSIADAPVGLNLASATWDGTEMVVVGSDIDHGNHATAWTALAEAYDPAADSWRELPAPPVSSQTSAVASAAGRIVAWEPYGPGSAEYVRAQDRWRSIGTGDLPATECYADGTVIGDVVFAWNCGTPTVLYPGSSTWAAVGGGGPLAGPPGYRDVAAGPSNVGTGVILEERETVMRDGTPTYGSPDAPLHLWLWKPLPVAPLPGPPTADQADRLFSDFIGALQYGRLAPYLDGSGTQDVLDRLRGASGALGDVAAGHFTGWRLTHHPYVQTLADGRFLVDVDLHMDDGSDMPLEVELGPGVTADGRRSLLVVTDVRPPEGWR